MEFNQFIDNLGKRLAGPLPGSKAQLRMASESRLEWLQQTFDLSKARKSGVLICFYPFRDKIMVILILRPVYDGVHGGQVAFPGGKQEETDRTLIDTALRETQEETGINAGNVRVIGTLSELYIPPSNFLVLPVVGYVPERPVFDPDPQEVDRLIELDINLLNVGRNVTVKTIQAGGYQINAPCYIAEDITIWGATAMIMSELLELIRS